MANLIRAAALTGYREVMSKLGLKPDRLLHRFGIRPALLETEDAMLSMEAVCDLLEESSRLAGCPDLGLQIARHQHFGVLGILGIAAHNARSPAEATQIVERFIFIQGTSLRLRIYRPSPVDPLMIGVGVEVQGMAPERQQQILMLFLGLIYQSGRLRDPDGTKIRLVSFRHKLTGHLQLYQRHFDIPVLDGQPVTALHVPTSEWSTPAPVENPKFSEFVEDYLARHYPAPASRFSEQVRAVLEPLIGTPQANREDIARVLAVHPRTMHRRLAEEATSFNAIKDEMLREQTLKFLRETQYSLDRISSMLGFPYQSSFSRSCRRWFGISPTTLRRKLKA
ncbi:AraC family transcriptional regulator [Nitratireductor basaltis]|nr:AraC family transcriptional regulator [Nitratireductor basaltis]